MRTKYHHTKYHLEVKVLTTDYSDDGKVLDSVSNQTGLTGEWKNLEDAQKAFEKIITETNTL